MEDQIDHINYAKTIENDANKKITSFSLFFRKERNIEAADMLKKSG